MAHAILLGSGSSQSSDFFKQAVQEKMMSTKLIEVKELEKAFSITPRPEIEAPAEVTVQPKKKRIRECADLRSFWDQDCETACKSVSA